MLLMSAPIIFGWMGMLGMLVDKLERYCECLVGGICVPEEIDVYLVELDVTRGAFFDLGRSWSNGRSTGGKSCCCGRGTS